jgi:hypothetical protein
VTIRHVEVLAVMNGKVASQSAIVRWMNAAALLALFSACTAPSSYTTGSSSTNTYATSSAVSPPATSSPFSVPTLFTSPLYSYSLTLPAGWQVVAAQTRWDGTTPIGHDDPIVDQLIGPEVPNRCKTVYLCGPIAWAVAAPTTKPLMALASDEDAAEARDHPCPVTPEQQSATSIDAESALVASKHCPSDGGLLVLRAIAIHNGVGYFFWLQDPSNEAAVEPQDRADFEALIGAVRLPN